MADHRLSVCTSSNTKKPTPREGTSRAGDRPAIPLIRWRTQPRASFACRARCLVGISIDRRGKESPALSQCVFRVGFGARGDERTCTRESKNVSTSINLPYKFSFHPFSAAFHQGAYNLREKHRRAGLATETVSAFTRFSFGMEGILGNK